MVVGGPPCQGFSQKGKRIGLKDERNFMFQQFVKVVKYVKPKYFVLENVPNILRPEVYFNPLVEWMEEQGIQFQKR